VPWVLWRCWFGGRKGIWPVKMSGEVPELLWLSVCVEVQMICIWSSWCHCHPVISCSSEIQNGLPFQYRLTQIVLGKCLLNGCSTGSSSCVLVKSYDEAASRIQRPLKPASVLSMWCGVMMWCPSPISVVSQHKLASGWGLQKQISATVYNTIRKFITHTHVVKH